MMFAKYFEYYTIILRGAVFFVDTLQHRNLFLYSRCSLEMFLCVGEFIDVAFTT